MQLYHTYTSDRRLLVLVENVWSEAQVRPLVPAGGHSALLLTSRRQLLALDGAYRLDLRVLAPDDAVRLLAEICGADRIHAEIQSARLIAGLCGSLPLALRIVGMRLAAPPQPSLAWVVRRLLDEQRRLAELNIGDRGVRAAYMVSYERLDEEVRLELVHTEAATLEESGTTSRVAFPALRGPDCMVYCQTICATTKSMPM